VNINDGTLIKARLDAAAASQDALLSPTEHRCLLAVDSIIAATLATIQAYTGGHDVRDQ